MGAGTLLSKEPLTIGFARRFATYKRADLLFRDEERLRRLLTNPWKPVQIIFSGKAHPADDGGKVILQRVWQATRDSSFAGRIAFVEDYDLHVAHRLVQGVDIWLNLPRVPMEASGTSGMKAAFNCVPQLSTLDGWWAEGFDAQNGWAIPLAEGDPAEVDAHDHEALFTLLEQEIVPLYYDRDERDVPVRWVRHMKHALRTTGQRFTAQRMVSEYARDYYVPSLEGSYEGDDPPYSPEAPNQIEMRFNGDEHGAATGPAECRIEVDQVDQRRSGAKLDQSDFVDPALQVAAENIFVERDRSREISNSQDHVIQSLESNRVLRHGQRTSRGCLHARTFRGSATLEAFEFFSCLFTLREGRPLQRLREPFSGLFGLARAGQCQGEPVLHRGLTGTVLQRGTECRYCFIVFTAAVSYPAEGIERLRALRAVHRRLCQRQGTIEIAVRIGE